MDGIASIFMWIGVSIVGLIVLLWFFPITMWFPALISGFRIYLVHLFFMSGRILLQLMLYFTLAKTL